MPPRETSATSAGGKYPVQRSTSSTNSTSSADRASRTARARFGGLDGLRAVAVALVLVFHLFPGALPGGFLGVDVFFVISGFLITSLLLRERARYGRIDLLGFWRRRARRLLPAVALVVLVSTALALAGSRDLLVGIAKQIAGAVFFVSNWVFVSSGSDYFTRDSPELFRNFWSLAVEEQFYIVLPLVVILLAGARAKALRGTILLALGIASAVYMGWLASTGADPTRIYFGSDSHSFGLLLGAVMAFILQPRDADALSGKPLRTVGQVVSLIVTIAGFGVLGVLAFTLPEGSPQSFLGGFQVATLAALAIVWAVTREGAWAGKALDVAPLRWIGERSYGIYLWHWPLLLIATSVVSSAAPALAHGTVSRWLPQVIALIATIVCAELSYRYVEQPVRTLGLRRAFRTYFSPRAYTPKQRSVAVAITTVLAITFPLTGIAIAVAPEHTSSADAILRGERILEEERNSASKDPHPSSTQGADDAPDAGENTDGSTEAEAAPPTPVTIDGRDITAVGDSVMLASYPELSEAFVGIDVDAAVSRGLWAGVSILADMQSAGKLRSVIVVGLGTNGPIDREALDELRSIAGKRPVVLVNAHGERDWIPPVNAELAAYAAEHSGVVLADWDSAIAPFPEFLAGDGIHPGSSGGVIYAEQMQAAFDSLAVSGEGVGWGVPRR